MSDHKPMTRLSEAVRHATALVHALDGAEMKLRDGHGRSLTVGRHPSADVDPCRWHRFVRAGRHHPRSVASTLVEGVGGRLVDRGGGIYGDRHHDGLRWFVTTLCPGLAVAALRNAELGPVPEEVVTATVRRDDALEVTMVGVHVDAPCLDRSLDDLALRIHAACLVAELGADLLAESPQS